MHIAIGARVLSHDKREGIAWYTDRMIAEMARQRPQYRFSVVVTKGSKISEDWPENIQLIEVGPHSFDPIALPWWIYVTLPKIVGKLKPDLFWAPDGLLPVVRSSATVATIHDVSPLLFPETMRFRDKLYFKRYLKRVIDQTNHFFTVSATSKREIVSTYNIQDKDISITYNGVREIFYPRVKEVNEATRHTYTSGKDYLIHVGAIHPRKNILAVLRAFDRYRDNSDKDIQLVFAGRKAWQSAAVLEHMQRGKWSGDIHWLDYVEDDVLARLISAARGLINFARHEGFGMSVIEGMACGTPVICAPNGALPEIAGEAGIFVHDVAELASAMDWVVSDPKLAVTKRELGLLRQKKFRWEQSARTGMTVFESIFDRANST